MVRKARVGAMMWGREARMSELLRKATNVLGLHWYSLQVTGCRLFAACSD